MSTVAICQSNYIPWKGYFDLIQRSDYFVFYDIVQYTKNDWRNRNKIQTAAGPKWLTVPVQNQYLGQPINQVKIADCAWQAKHWKTLQQNYYKAPYFSRYANQIGAIYQKEWKYLSELNQEFITTLCNLLQIKTKLVKAETLVMSDDRNQRLIDICHYFNATDYLSGPAAQSYLDIGLFKQHGIEVQWMQYNHYQPYTQRYQPFEHAVSVLDLLFNTGPDALTYL